MPILLRDATEGDASGISALVIGLSQRWIASDCTQEGAAILLASMAEDATANRLRGDGYHYVVAELDGRLVGVAALRRPSHLYHLFVVEHMQRRGVARALWDRVRVHAAPYEPVTVNASRVAIPVYRHLGFEPAGAERRERGIRSTPMQWCRR
jgi:GNAT superfamily N-acetyltransferase